MATQLVGPKGYSAAAGRCGIKKEGMDLALLVSERRAKTAVVSTQNQFKAAPVQYNLEKMKTSTSSRAILINSGVANAATGIAGLQSSQKTAKACAEALNFLPEEILLASTGVIGLDLPVEKINIGSSELAKKLSPNAFDEVSQAIMTTDTYPKTYNKMIELSGHTIHILGLAKGAGMICPNMSTMLGFILTDASIEETALQKALSHVVQHSFNAITVDGDSSTNDSVILMANGAAENPLIKTDDDDYLVFCNALMDVCIHLAKFIAKDGEGSSHLIEVRVSGAQSKREALACARSVAGSSLVKTAVFGGDPNWGRIACALGYAGVAFDPAEVSIWIGDILVCESGGEAFFDEELASQAMEGDEVFISCVIGNGTEEARAWGCDLSYDYVRINANYRS